jgi:hypothetical protein
MTFGKKDGFQDRVGRAADAKQKALDALKSRPPVDPAVQAERREAHLAKQAAEAEARAQKKEADRAAREAAAAEAAAAEAAAVPEPSEADRKAARDARYAARKNRKG